MEHLGTHSITVSAAGIQTVSADNYNCMFDFTSGYMERWGKTVEDDNTPPVLEVVDIEVTTSCTGVRGVLCPFCYKANSPNGVNMSFETFKQVFHKFPKTLTQIAFSADSCLKVNPDLFKMMKYCRENLENYVIPSISVACLDKPEAVALMESGVGCVGVSLYDNKDACYDTIKILVDTAKEMNYPAQINIQAVVSDYSYPKIMEVLDDVGKDPRLNGVNCIVYLSLKQKGRGTSFKLLPQEKWNALLSKTSDVMPFFGVDVCATKILVAYDGSSDTEQAKSLYEPCESGYYSGYINVHGMMYPCSFLEGVGDWKTGENLLDKSFADIWEGDRFNNHREKLVDVRCLTCDKGCIFWEI